MKAIILSAGQGSRLLPLTETLPKCLLPVGSQTVIERQISALFESGIREVVVITGFAAGAVERRVRNLRRDGLVVRCLFNPFFNVADNLASCWMARHEMDQDFILLNGDTLFDGAVCRRLMQAAPAPVTLAIDHKDAYDSDDMKVRLAGTRLLEVGKSLEPENVHGESIGMIRFTGEGPHAFAELLDQIMRTPNSLSWWYLKAIGILAEQNLVETLPVTGLRWAEIDFPHDLDHVRSLFTETAEDTATELRPQAASSS